MLSALGLFYGFFVLIMGHFVVFFAGRHGGKQLSFLHGSARATVEPRLRRPIRRRVDEFCHPRRCYSAEPPESIQWRRCQPGKVLEDGPLMTKDL